MWIWIGILVLILLALTDENIEDSAGRTIVGSIVLIVLIITLLFVLGGC